MRSRSLPIVWPPDSLQCPSSQPEVAGAVAFGLVDHADGVPLVGFLEKVVPVTPELLELAKPLRPTEVFRFAAPCEGEKCSHWGGTECTLVNRIVQILPVVSSMPPCRVRSECRWFSQRGRDACARCPQVVTQNEHPSDGMLRAATPPDPPDPTL
jgi:hypothetical protein